MKNFDAEFCVRYVEAKRNEEEPSFLDKKELEYLEHLVEKVFLNFVSEKRGINSYIAFHLADYINFLKNDAWCAAYREGMNTLGFSENVEALYALMNS